MAESFTPTSDLRVSDMRAALQKSSRCLSDGRPSRAEWLEVISFVAVIGMTEYSAWITPILDRRD